MKRVIVLCAAMSWAGRAEAVDSFMWGVGPHLGTMVVPAQFPSAFPPAVLEDEDSTATRVGGDIDVGIDGVYYANRMTRIGASAGMDVAPSYRDLHLLLRYNWVRSSDALDILVGGGLGVGTMQFDWEGSESLRVPYYPFRGEVSAMIRDRTRAYQFTPYAQYNLPSNHFYTSAAGEDVDVGTGIYAMIGIEGAILFGDFTPPKKRK